jgi:glycine/D-amino acid oxidase-like deaminating enzyme
MKRRRVAIIGAGIMGSATALLLARRGVDVVLFDADAAPMSGASRWNEGKIHLGFLYSADPSFRTARRLLPGGLAFRPLVEELIGSPLEHITETDDLFLVHRDSILSPALTRAYFDAVAQMIRSEPDAGSYLVDVSDARVRQLSPEELEEVAAPGTIVAGFAVPERSIATQWVADRLVDALAAEPAIEMRLGTRVVGVDSLGAGASTSLEIDSRPQFYGGFDAVVNASWQGMPRIDASVGIPSDHPWSHRYRVALFVETDRPVRIPSAVVCTGPFGDVKSYADGGGFYASWYPAGLLASGEEIDPPPVPELDVAARAAIAEEMLLRLTEVVPAVRELRSAATRVVVEGGWVFARGQGPLDDPSSTLHRRDRIGVSRVGSYFTADTGKYSMAPWLALQIAEAIAPQN